MLISVILIAVTITFLTSGTTFLARTEISASDKALAQSAADFVKDQLLYASEVKVVYVDEGNPVRPSFPSVRGFAVLYIGDETGATIENTGRLYYKRPDVNGYVDILGDEIYKGKELALGYSAMVATAGEGSSKAASFEIAAKVVRDGAQTKEASHTFRMYNIGLNSEPEYDTSVSSWDGANPGNSKKFYLLITPSSDDYARGGLIMELSGIDNAIDANGTPYHNPSAAAWKDLSGAGNDMKLTFTSNPNAVNEKWVSFDGSGDYGTSAAALNLSVYEKITVEVCFRPALNDDSRQGTLYEMAKLGDEGGFGEIVNTNGNVYQSGMVFTHGRVGNESINSHYAGVRYFEFANDPAKFTTHAMTYSHVTDPMGRRIFIDGIYEGFVPNDGHTASTATWSEPTSSFVNDFFYIAASLRGKESFFKGDIAAVRIYGRKLNEDEIAGNALMDQLLYN